MSAHMDWRRGIRKAPGAEWHSAAKAASAQYKNAILGIIPDTRKCLNCEATGKEVHRFGHVWLCDKCRTKAMKEESREPPPCPQH